MRTKEHAHDYRYFPDPDLMPFEPTEKWLAEVKSRTVELPLARKQRFMKEYGLPAGDAEVFKNNVELGNQFEKGAQQISKQAQGEIKAKQIKLVANLIINNRSMPPQAQPYPITEIVNLAALVQNNSVSGSNAQQVILPEIIITGKSAQTVIQEKGLAQVSDTAAIEKFCDEAIAANPGPVADFKAGKAAALNFLKGQVMKLSKGKANPALAGEILERKLKA
jgi:aspartyl-tRNA(Asn)/glutamyl-tRNA(Gln) amidotransferase subunit B